MKPGLRFTPEAADDLRAAVDEVQGAEVFAVGDVVDGCVVAVQIVARGQIDRVVAPPDRARRGQVVVHNHPSGDLRPSDADMHIAGRFAEGGVGFVIVDGTVTRSHWVVEPAPPRDRKLDADGVRAVFEVDLAASLPGYEPRPAQVAMALDVAKALSEGEHLLVEAGTGTGKSLAYLVPAALWAQANEGCVVVSTHTRALQAQIVASDAALLKRAGIDAPVAVLEGRGNYACRRRAALATDDLDGLEDEARQTLQAVLDWIAASATGRRAEVPVRLPPDVWERVESDADLTLRHRCEHYDRCFYYEARRKAADAKVLVVNHALLLADLAIRHQGGGGILPKYDRVILDEAQHLEDVATGALSVRLTRLAVRRALVTLTGGRKGGALDRLMRALNVSTLPREVVDAACRAAADAVALAGRLLDEAERAFDGLTSVVDPTRPTVRVDAAYEASDDWQLTVSPQVSWLGNLLATLAGHLDAIDAALGEHKLPEASSQPLLDARRARRRLGAQAAACQSFLERSADVCRWLQGGRQGEVAVCAAPIDVARQLAEALWEAVPGVVATSATLSVAGDFSFFQQRVGLASVRTVVHPSPFDHFRQAVLGLPNDLPPPDHPRWHDVTTRVILDAVRGSGGGAFVLCTSFRDVDHFAAALRRHLPPHIAVFAQGEVARHQLLERFREHRDAVLVGTDSFWEGVSVKGDGLRLVILPRLPFRVPTEPLQQARHERLKAQGVDPFRALTLPQAILKLRQGYGRLIRSTTDRGVVLLLDGRVHDKAYGRVVLASLPPARRVTAPNQRVQAELRAFFGREDRDG